MTFDEIVAEAMKLSADEREALAAVVLTSLDDAAADETSVASAWEDEAHAGTRLTWRDASKGFRGPRLASGFRLAGRADQPASGSSTMVPSPAGV